MVKIPDKSLFPGTGDKGNGIPENFKTQEQWLNFIKTNGCGNCHQMGNYATRIIPATLGKSNRHAMPGPSSLGWTGRSRHGALYHPIDDAGWWPSRGARRLDRPHRGGRIAKPQPAAGRSAIERNLVITVRDWLDPKHYLHDLTTTDRRKPTVNAYGPSMAIPSSPAMRSRYSTRCTTRNRRNQPPVRDGTPSSALANEVVAPSPYFGMEQTWDSKVNAHTSAMDQDGRVYWAAQN